jgi:hypothetical protein
MPPRKNPKRISVTILIAVNFKLQAAFCQWAALLKTRLFCKGSSDLREYAVVKVAGASTLLMQSAVLMEFTDDYESLRRI